MLKRGVAKDKSETDLLGEISDKLEALIVLSLIQGRTRREQVRILASYDGPLSKRELERLTGIDRHEF